MNPLQPGKLTLVSLRNRRGVERQLELAEEGAARVRAEYSAALSRDAREAGLADELEELRHPITTVPVEAPTVRVRALKPFRIFVRNRYDEQEEYSAATFAVVDVPKSCLRKLGDRVEQVPPSTELLPLALTSNDHQLLAHER